LEQSLLIKKALTEIRRLKALLSTKNEKDPIAIVGMSCRFPGGVSTPEEYWRLLIEKREGLRSPPKDRWDHDLFFDPSGASPDSIYFKQASFVDYPVRAFDAKFFGISPREADEIDPQHRFLLELSWEALERAGIVPEKIKGTNLGIFVAIISSEYATYNRDNYQITPYFLTGTLNHMASGRIAYFYGTHGPAISLDTACSSSMVAFHDACRSLQAKESNVALVGGINLMVSPYALASLCQLRALSHDGRCKPFDKDADGYGRGEGGGFLVLKRLSDAIKDKDHILAIAKGSAVNHDGRTKGLTIPSLDAQVQVIQKALADAKINEDEISFFEAHGTGTQVGDPIEIKAIETVFGQRKNKRPLPIGSAKANIGHCEAAAGLAGLMKVILSLKNKTIPAHMNFHERNPDVQFDAIPAYLPLENEPWKSDSHPRIAAANSFGFSGTNAHVILQEWEEGSPKETTPEFFESGPYFLPLSGKTKSSLNEYVRRYARFLSESPQVELDKMQSAICLHRSHFKHRLVVKGNDRNQLLEALNKIEREGLDSELNSSPMGHCLVYLGDVHHSFQKFDRLYCSYAVYQQIFDECWKKVREGSHFSSLELLQGQKLSSDQELLRSLCSCVAFIGLLESFGFDKLKLMASGVGLLFASACSGALEIEVVAKLLKGQLEDVRLKQSRYSILHSQTAAPFHFSSSSWKELAKESLQDLDLAKILNHKIGDFLIDLSDAYLKHSSFPIFAAEDLKSIVMEGFRCGYSLDWKAILPNVSLKHILLPTYPFDQQSFWFDKGETKSSLNGEEMSLNQHPLKGQMISSPLGIYQHHFLVSPSALPEIKDTHGLLHIGQIMEMCYSIANSKWKLSSSEVALQGVVIHRALLVGELLKIHAVLNEENHQLASVSLYTYDKTQKEWLCNVEANFEKNGDRDFPKFLENSKKRLTLNKTYPISRAFFYEMLNARGVNLGASVQWVESASFNPESSCIFATLKGADGLEIFHRGVPDALAQLFHLFLAEEEKTTRLMVVSWEKTEILNADAKGPLYAVIEKLSTSLNDLLEGNICLFDANQNPCFLAHQMRMKKLVVKAQDKAMDEHQEVIRKIFESSDPELRREYCLQLVKALLGKLLNMSPGSLQSGELLYELGFDSIMGIDFRNQIMAALKVEIDLEKLFANPSIDQVGELVFEGLQKEKSQPITIRKNPWLKGALEDKTSFRLYCFPYGAGGASEYAGWESQLGPDFRVISVQLPGREERIAEAPIGEMSLLLDALNDAFEEHLTTPFAFYGHSIGALIAYVFTLHLQQKGKPLPRHLFVGAFSSPTIWPNPWFKELMIRLKKAGIHSLPKIDESLSEKQIMRAFSAFTSGASLEFDQVNEEYVRKLLPSIWADLRLVEKFALPANQALSIPMTALGGTLDDRVSVKDIKAWKSLSAGNFSFSLLEGSHFFLRSNEKQKELLSIIKEKLFAELTSNREDR
jgi:acyl transferase domain-containing protein/surfactin synthase thioesterase subunit/aryl carrier-like protein